MSITRFARIAAVSAAALLSFSVSAGDSVNMAVSANVIGTCKLVSVPPLPFGLLDQVAAPNLNPPAVTVTYRCTKGTSPVSFTVGGSAAPTYSGLLANTTTPGDTIPYTITWAAPTTQGSGLGSAVAQVPVLLSGSMLGANYQNVTAGAYAHTVAVVITP